MYLIKDYFYSNKNFKIEEVQEGVLKTKNIPDDLQRYYHTKKYISHTNNKNSILEKIYSSFQKLNFNYKYKLITKYFKSGSLLDYGCGNGLFLEYMVTKGFQCTGYEPLFKKNNDKLTIYNNLKKIDKKYDVISLWHVLEHLEDIEGTLKFLQSRLNKNGIIIIALPNYTSYDAKYYKNFWAAWDVPRHIYHFSKKGAINFFTSNGLYLNKIYPLPLDSFYVSFLSAKYKNSIIQKILFPFIAQLSNIKALKNGNWSSLVYVLKH